MDKYFTYQGLIEADCLYTWLVDHTLTCAVYYMNYSYNHGTAHHATTYAHNYTLVSVNVYKGNTFFFNTEFVEL